MSVELRKASSGVSALHAVASSTTVPVPVRVHVPVPGPGSRSGPLPVNCNSRHGSLSTGGDQRAAAKRKRRFSGPGPFAVVRPKHERIELPQRFLLGGNINDPLNLNNLIDDSPPAAQEPSASSASEPAAATDVAGTASDGNDRLVVEMVLPADVHDPLRLKSSDHSRSNSFSGQARRARRRKRRVSCKSDESAIPGKKRKRCFSEGADSGSDLNVTYGRQNSDGGVEYGSKVLKVKTLPHDFSRSGSGSRTDPIVSPVCENVTATDWQQVDRGGSQKRCEDSPLAIARSKDPDKRAPQPPAKKLPSALKYSAKFLYGNYDKYYGKRLLSEIEDPRIPCLKAEWFTGRRVLDIGCNCGYLTLYIAKTFQPHFIVGLDIDRKLIKKARKWLHGYVTEKQSSQEVKYPAKLREQYGPAEQASPVVRSHFPHNICFKTGNYVLETNDLLDNVRPRYDTVIAFSITKWIHLNWGDDGLKRFFKRIYRELTPGGLLLLEPQPFNSYRRKRNLTRTIAQNFENIQFKPAQFTEYLLSKEVGFSSCEQLGVPSHSFDGFRRPIHLFTKPMQERFPNHQ